MGFACTNPDSDADQEITLKENDGKPGFRLDDLYVSNRVAKNLFDKDRPEKLRYDEGLHAAKSLLRLKHSEGKLRHDDDFARWMENQHVIKFIRGNPEDYPECAKIKPKRSRSPLAGLRPTLMPPTEASLMLWPAIPRACRGIGCNSDTISRIGPFDHCLADKRPFDCYNAFRRPARPINGLVSDFTNDNSAFTNHFHDLVKIDIGLIVAPGGIKNIANFQGMGFAPICPALRCILLRLSKTINVLGDVFVTTLLIPEYVIEVRL